MQYFCLGVAPVAGACPVPSRRRLPAAATLTAGLPTFALRRPTSRFSSTGSRGRTVSQAVYCAARSTRHMTSAPSSRKSTSPTPAGPRPRRSFDSSAGHRTSRSSGPSRCLTRASSRPAGSASRPCLSVVVDRATQLRSQPLPDLAPLFQAGPWMRLDGRDERRYLTSWIGTPGLQRPGCAGGCPRQCRRRSRSDPPSPSAAHLSHGSKNKKCGRTGARGDNRRSAAAQECQGAHHWRRSRGSWPAAWARAPRSGRVDG